MKYLKILLSPIKIKGDPEDEETLQTDLYEEIQARIENETLKWSLDEEDQEDDED